MDPDFASTFVQSWEAAWNAHDVGAVLAHLHDDAAFASPIAERLAPGTGGILCGKERIRDYWSRALVLIPTLHFTVERYFVGVGVLVIQYRNQQDVVVNEVLLFRERLVISGYGTYGVGHDNPAGLPRYPQDGTIDGAR